MLCEPKANVTKAAKKTSLPVKTAIQLQRHEEGFWKKKKNNNNNNKKDFTDLESSPRVSHQNKFESASFGALSPWANEAAVRNYCVIVTSSFSETKGFFCFSFNNRSLRVVCIRNILKRRANQQKKYRVMFFYSIESGMQNFRRFRRKKKTT